MTTPSPTVLPQSNSKSNDDDDEIFGFIMILIGAVCFSIFGVIMIYVHQQMRTAKKPLISGDYVMYQGSKGIVKGFDIETAKLEVFIITTGRTEFVREYKLQRFEDYEAEQDALEEQELARRLADQEEKDEEDGRHRKHSEHKSHKKLTELKGGRGVSEPRKSEKNLKNLKVTRGGTEPRKSYKNLNELKGGRSVSEPRKSEKNLKNLKETRGGTEPRKSYKNLNELKDNRGIAEPKDNLRDARGSTEPRRSSYKNFKELQDPKRQSQQDVQNHSRIKSREPNTTPGRKRSPPPHRASKSTDRSGSNSRLSPSQRANRSSGNNSRLRTARAPQKVLKSILDSDDGQAQVANSFGVSLTELRHPARSASMGRDSVDLDDQGRGLHKRRLMLNLGNRTVSSSSSLPVRGSSMPASPQPSRYKLQTSRDQNQSSTNNNPPGILKRPPSRPNNNRYSLDTIHSTEGSSWLAEDDNEPVLAKPLGSAV